MDNSTDTHFEIIPVDPHRFLAFWKLDPELLLRAENVLGIPHTEAGWFLRAFRLADPGHGPEQAFSMQDFPITGSRQETYFALSFPGGFVSAVLGVKDRNGRFSPLLRAPCVALPEAPESGASAEVHPAEEVPAPGDETAFGTIDDTNALPEELRHPPPAASESPPEPTRAPVSRLPETPALDEGMIVTAALSGKHPSSVRAEKPGRETPERSTFPAATGRTIGRGSHARCRLASRFDGESGGAPLALRGALAVEGILRPGQRLEIDGMEILPRMDGRFTWTRPLEDFSLLWSLLTEAAFDVTASSALDSRFSEFLLRTLIDIEGEVRDPDYRVYLPPGIRPDASGRFRLIREIGPDFDFIPRIAPLTRSVAAP